MESDKKNNAPVIAQKVTQKSSFIGVSAGVLSIQNIETIGQKEVVVNSSGAQSYFELTTDNEYQPLQAFKKNY